MPRIDLPQGTVHYGDTGGKGPVVVFVHGLLTDGSLWDGVVEALPQARCLSPTWPLGSHVEPMRPDADLGPRGIARLIAAFLEALGLEDVTVVANDSGGAITQLLVTEHPERIGRLVLTPCDCFENFLPPLFRPLQWIAHVPPLVYVTVQLFRLRSTRRLPFAYGRLVKHGLPREIGDRWLGPVIAQPAIRRDLARFLRAIDSADTVAAAARLPAFTHPALILWSREERSFPFAHAERLAKLLPDARLVELEDTWAFVPLDQPAATAAAIRAFLEETAAVPAAA